MGNRFQVEVNESCEELPQKILKEFELKKSIDPLYEHFLLNL
ncbi:hypothetical protein [Gloeothece verrucosa]|nr:hypothetical protein [Gloeothece verrucosa]